METRTGLEEELVPQAKDVPADAEVYRQVRRRLRRLFHARRLLRKTRDIIQINVDYISEMSYRWQMENPNIPFRLDKGKSRSQVNEEFKKAREWLMGMVKMHEKVYDKPQMTRILRVGVEKERGEESVLGKGDAEGDLVKLYMALTDADEDDYENDDEWDAEDHVDSAFLISLQYNFADKYADIFESLRSRLGQKSNRLATPDERVMMRMVEKAQAVKVDSFACAVSLSTIKSLPREEQACPICRNEYLDFQNFNIKDLIADYPVRIKYCGHIFGKSCLEQWIDMPLVEAAKYPHHTCPVCRIEIEGCQTPQAPLELVTHTSDDASIKKVVAATDDEIDVRECCEGILRCISEEYVLKQLGSEMEYLRLGEKVDNDKLLAYKEVTESRRKEVDEEKKLWGFLGEEKEILWDNIVRDWVDSGKKT